MSESQPPSRYPRSSTSSSQLDQFLAHALASGLVSSEQLKEATNTPGVMACGPDRAVDRLGEYLVSKGILTSWQCGKLSSGQYKGFLLGQYRLLGPAPGHDAFHYLAEDVETHRRVTLLIKPNPSHPDGLEYRVVE